MINRYSFLVTLLSAYFNTYAYGTTLQIATCFYGTSTEDLFKHEIKGEQRSIIIEGTLFTRHIMLEPEDWCVGPHDNNKEYIRCDRKREKSWKKNSKTMEYYYKRYSNQFTHDRGPLQEIQKTPLRCRFALRSLSGIAW